MANKIRCSVKLLCAAITDLLYEWFKCCCPSMWSYNSKAVLLVNTQEDVGSNPDLLTKKTMYAQTFKYIIMKIFYILWHFIAWIKTQSYGLNVWTTTLVSVVLSMLYRRLLGLHGNRFWAQASFVVYNYYSCLMWIQNYHSELKLCVLVKL